MEQICYPLFLFENVETDLSRFVSFARIYKNIEILKFDLAEGWNTDGNDWTIYDAKGRLLSYSLSWEKFTTKGLFWGVNIDHRVEVKINFSENAPAYTDLLKQFLKNSLQENIINIKNQLDTLKVQTGFFCKRKVIDDKSVTIRLADDSYISFIFLKQAMLDFIKKFLTSDLTRIKDDIELLELVELVNLLW